MTDNMNRAPSPVHIPKVLLSTGERVRALPDGLRAAIAPLLPYILNMRARVQLHLMDVKGLVIDEIPTATGPVKLDFRDLDALERVIAIIDGDVRIDGREPREVPAGLPLRIEPTPELLAQLEALFRKHLGVPPVRMTLSVKDGLVKSEVSPTIEAAVATMRRFADGVALQPELREALDDVCAAALLHAQHEELSSAVREVLAERRRVVEVEGFDAKHDDEHDGGELAAAAAAYLMAAADVLHPLSSALGVYTNGQMPDVWPWDQKWWKPSEPDRMLVKGIGLALAELERLHRARLVAGSITKPRAL